MQSRERREREREREGDKKKLEALEKLHSECRMSCYIYLVRQTHESL